jgi:hypothetical protein
MRVRCHELGSLDFHCLLTSGRVAMLCSVTCNTILSNIHYANLSPLPRMFTSRIDDIREQLVTENSRLTEVPIGFCIIRVVGRLTIAAYVK